MSDKLPVYVCSIAKNEEKHVRRWAESAKDADGIFLLDTGSEDNTVAIARELGVTVFEKKYEKWSFAVARNDLREMLPEHDAWLVNLDLDEVLIPNWREYWRNIPDEANRLRYRYIWNWKEDGRPGVEYHGDKLVRRFTHTWVNKVHEVNKPLVPEVQYFLPNFEIHHHADNTKSRGSYLPLLLEDVAENPNNDRNTYYAARELFFYGRKEESIELFKRHLTMPESVWPPERAWSMRYLAKMLPDEAFHWHMRACAEYPSGAETWTDLAKYFYGKKDWLGMYFAAKRSLDCQLYKGLYLTEPDDYGWWPRDMVALSAFNLGLYAEAVRFGQAAVELNPTDQRLKENLFWYKNVQSSATVVIPYKSNLKGLISVVENLSKDRKVAKIVIVADGLESYKQLSIFNEAVTKVQVDRGTGIHKMWNIGLNVAHPGSHVFFVNDDVALVDNCVSDLVAALDRDATIGLVCPHYANVPAQGNVETTTTCQGRYDGTGGMAGFAMMLSNELVPFFRFNEDMKWWWGDNLLVDWVTKVAERRCVITSSTSCKHAHSQTVNNDPPENFASIVENDRAIYQQLTNYLDTALPLRAEIYFQSLPSMTHRGAIDIHEHLVTLRSLAHDCEHVTEFGTRYGISTSALICGQPQKVVSYDINAGWFAPYKSEAEALAQVAGVNFQFIEGDVLGVDIEETDLLFIDTHHTYNQLTAELNKHASKVRKYIVMHDTVTYGTADEPPYENGVVSGQLNGLQSVRTGLQMALEDFLEGNSDWVIGQEFKNNNGLTILTRVDTKKSQQ